MTRFRLLLINEFKLVRTTLPVHLIAIIQPTVMYLLMAAVLVHPTFDMNVRRPVSEDELALVSAMEQVGSPIGLPYINPILVDEGEGEGLQVVSVESRDGAPTAVQAFSFIDNNQVKNYRNRLTAAALLMWHEELGAKAVTIEEYPRLPAGDIAYTAYCGMALLPMTVFMAATLIGGVLTAQDFEGNTILEYRLSPVSPALVIGARLLRLMLMALLSAGMLLLALGGVTGVWPSSVLQVGFILLPVSIMASGQGIMAGLLLRSSIPTFVVGLTTSFGAWLLGSGFGLAAGFGGLYEAVGRFIPNTYTVELLFPLFYGGTLVGNSMIAGLLLILMSASVLRLVSVSYQRRVLQGMG